MPNPTEMVNRSYRTEAVIILDLLYIVIGQAIMTSWNGHGEFLRPPEPAVLSAFSQRRASVAERGNNL